MKFRSAFSLLEIITVVVIIGALAALATTSLKSATLKARDGRRVSDINAMRKALEIYKVNNEVYPTEAQFILGAPFKIGNDTLIQKLPFNPKVADGPCAINEYLYRQDNGGASYHIFYCLGQKVNDAGPGPCIATPGHHCANCTGGSCANKCGGDDGCGQPCPAATCSYPRPFCEAVTGNCICRNNSDCNSGQFCSASGACIANNTCADNNDCGLCKKCSAGICIAQTASEDLKNECGTTDCLTGTCNGVTGGEACGAYNDNLPHNCDLSGGYGNRKCIGSPTCSCVADIGGCGGSGGFAPGQSNGCGMCNTACNANYTCVSPATRKCARPVPMITDTQNSPLVTSNPVSGTCGNCGGIKNTYYTPARCSTDPSVNPAQQGCDCCPTGCTDLINTSSNGPALCIAACDSLVAQGYSDWVWRGSSVTHPNWGGSNQINAMLNQYYFGTSIDINYDITVVANKTCNDPGFPYAEMVSPYRGHRGQQSCVCVRYAAFGCP